MLKPMQEGKKVLIKNGIFFLNSANVGANSLLLRIGKQKYRTLLDSGAEVSLIHRRVYDGLKQKPKLKVSLNLATVGNTSLYVDGCAEIKFSVGGLNMNHKFYIVRNLNRNIILCLD